MWRSFFKEMQPSASWSAVATLVASGLLAIGLLQKGAAQANSGSLKRSVAVLKVPEDGEIDPVKTYGTEYMAQVAGIPYAMTSSLDSATTHKIIVATDGIDDATFSPSQREKIREYVEGGGVFLAGNFKDNALFDVFGIVGEDYARDRARITFLTDRLSGAFDWINRKRERTLSIGEKERSVVALSRGYVPGEATVLAKFEDGEAAFVKNSYGAGTAYLLGVALRDVTVRNHLNNDFGAERAYSNGFEPSGDAFPLLLRSLYRKHVDAAVWKHTAPRGKQSAVILTHDVDSESGFRLMGQFARYENRKGIEAQYFISTRYVDDALDSDFYVPYRDSVETLTDLGQVVGSHSVGHFPDFDDFPLGQLGNTRATYQPFYDGSGTSGGSILGELEVSKSLLEEDTDQRVRSFRAGYLLHPEKLINGLEKAGYQYNSTRAAGQVMTSFPYRVPKNDSFDGPMSTVWEIPMTMSDSFDDLPFNEDTYPDRVDLWLSVHEKYAENGSPTVLLIHPNRKFKIDALEMFVNGVSTETAFMSLQGYGAYWEKRLTAPMSTTLRQDTLTIREGEGGFPDQLSLAIDAAHGADTIEVVGPEGKPLQYETTRRNEKVLIHSVSDNPLPVELSSFEGTTSEKGVILRWRTAGETNNAGFEVQRRRADQKDWSGMGFVESKVSGGTSSTSQTYRYVVDNLKAGTHEFRLRQRDLDGSTKTIGKTTVEVSPHAALYLEKPSPNPASSLASLSFMLRKKREATITLYNVLGEEVKTLYHGHPPAGERQQVEVTVEKLSSGIYFYRLQAGQKTRTRRLTVVR